MTHLHYVKILYYFYVSMVVFLFVYISISIKSKFHILGDIDVLFSTKFIKNVQDHTRLGKQVYFPILFSEYDTSKPGYAEDDVSDGYERNHAKLPVTIAESTGVWRIYGFGLACMYQKDLGKYMYMIGCKFFIKAIQV